MICQTSRCADVAVLMSMCRCELDGDSLSNQNRSRRQGATTDMEHNATKRSLGVLQPDLLRSSRYGEKKTPCEEQAVYRTGRSPAASAPQDLPISQPRKLNLKGAQQSLMRQHNLFQTTPARSKCSPTRFNGKWHEECGSLIRSGRGTKYHCVDSPNAPQ